MLSTRSSTNDKTVHQAVEREIERHRSLKTPDSWIKRDPLLLPLTGALPFNAEPPTTELLKHMITPSKIHYVRNHGEVPKLDWKKHKLSVSGLVKHPRSYSMDELVKIKEPVELIVTLVCDGNRRKELNIPTHTRGFHWGPGAVSTAKWKGIRIRDIIEDCGGLKDKADYIHLTGAEDLVKGKYSTSVPLPILPEDAIIAFEMNGEKLPPDHGFPIRVILPGFVGGRMIKWLEKIEFTDKESDNFYHLHDNKVLPYPEADIEIAEQSEWWEKPEYALYEQCLNSVIVYPEHEEWLEISDGKYEVKGYAYTGGGRVISRVEISLDKGKSWILMKCEYPEGSVTHIGRRVYAWCHWKGEVPIYSLLRARSMVVRAWDQSNNSQPRDSNWNVGGFMNNSWYKVKISTGGEDMKWITFKHPVLPGARLGGWLDLKYPHASKPVEIAAQGRRQFTREEVKKHNTKEDLWVVIDGCVIDLSSYLPDHPGGPLPIILKGGSDASQLFHEIHGEDAIEIKERYTIGVLSQTSKQTVEQDFALDARKWIPAKLKKKEDVSHDTRRFIFSLSDTKKVGLPVGQHLLLAADIKNHGRDEVVVRPYTPVFPVTDDEDKGCVELVIKIYFPNGRPGGLMTNHLESLKIGDSVQIKGAAGPILYHGHGVFSINGQSIKAKKVSMIAGGTGITPIFQLMRCIHSNPHDKTKISLLFSNKTQDDILLFDELKKMEEDKRFKIWHTITRAKEKKPKDWKYSTGYVDEHMIREHLFEPSDDTIALLCGPPVMLHRACFPNLRKFGFTNSNMFEF